MNFKTRFLIIIAINFVVLILMLMLFAHSSLDLTSRLVDLNLANTTDRTFFIQFLGLLLFAFSANFIAGLGKNSFSRRELKILADIMMDANEGRS